MSCLGSRGTHNFFFFLCVCANRKHFSLCRWKMVICSKLQSKTRGLNCWPISLINSDFWIEPRPNLLRDVYERPAVQSVEAVALEVSTFSYNAVTLKRMTSSANRSCKVGGPRSCLKHLGTREPFIRTEGTSPALEKQPHVVISLD